MNRFQIMLPDRLTTISPATGRLFIRYGLFMALTNLAWESAHLPLYTLWANASTGYLVFVVTHCTAGDLMIAFATLASALLLTGNLRDPCEHYSRVVGVTLVLGIAYTVYSEWLNVSIRQSWAYSDLMPVIPVIDTGLSPVAQWIFLPLLGLLWVRNNLTKEDLKNDT